MLDINLFRDGKDNKIKELKESEKRRFNSDKGLVDKVIKLDAEWRKSIFFF